MRSWIMAIVFTLGAVPASPADNGTGSLPDALSVLKAHRFVDLTHPFAPGIPHWKGAPNERVKTLYTVAKDGFRINEYCHVGSGAHTSMPPRIFTRDSSQPTALIPRTC